ncbi:nicotinate-nucleotide--dimethylbenzimidazole phosphoribosyltransferase, partial [Streptomyces niveus]
MTDTGQVPGEGQPENAGMAEQPGDPVAGSYAYLGPSESAPEDDDLLLMPSSQGAWGDPQPAPPSEPLAPVAHAVPEPVAAGQIPPQTGQGEFVPQQAQTQSQLATYSQPEPQPQLAPEFQPVPGPAEHLPEYPAPDMSHMQVQPVAAPEAYTPVDAPTEAPVPEAVPQPAPELTREAVQEAPQEAAEAVAPPMAAEAPAPVSEPGAHETGGRDSGSVDLGAVRIPTA